VSFSGPGNAMTFAKGPCLALGNGLFVEARVDGTIETTSDGKTWTVTATEQKPCD
jgi:hypothetical protein